MIFPRPNCLLTQSPLLFIAGPNSIFIPKNNWGDLPRFLFDHGFEAQILKLLPTSYAPFHSQINDHFAKNQVPKHLILEPSIATRISLCSPSTKQFFKSCNVIKQKDSPRSSVNKNLRAWIHDLSQGLNPGSSFGHLWKLNENSIPQFDRFLDRVISLAESEFQEENSVNEAYSRQHTSDFKNPS